MRLFGSAGDDWLMSRKQVPPVELTASGAYLRAMFPVPREAPPEIDPETLARLEKAAFAVADAAPPAGPGVEDRVRELLSGMTQPVRRDAGKPKQ